MNYFASNANDIIDAGTATDNHHNRLQGGTWT